MIRMTLPTIRILLPALFLVFVSNYAVKSQIQETRIFEVNTNYIPFDKAKLDSLSELMNQKKYKAVINEIEKSVGDTLLSKYNIGYALFAIDKNKEVTEGNEEIRKGFEIAWDQIKILNITKQSYTLKISGIKFKTPSIGYGEIDGNIVVLPRNRKMKVTYFKSSRFNIIIETIINSNDGIICLLGFTNG